MLRANVGRATVLARPGERRLWVLSASNRVLWDLCQADISREEISRALAQRFDITVEAAQTHLDQLYQNWRDVGLIVNDALSAQLSDEPYQPIRRFQRLGPLQAPLAAWRLMVAQQQIVVYIEDQELRSNFSPLLAPLHWEKQTPNPAAITSSVILSGHVDSWRLLINSEEVDRGTGWEAALVATLSALTEVGCLTGERLIVVHGAGLIAPEGPCVLLAAPGGSGKSTLSVALECNGFRLLSDDVVPISHDGLAFGLGLPICVKIGSFEVLAKLRPDLDDAPNLIRFGKSVRFLPPVNRPVTDAVPTSLLLFPKYKPDAVQSCVMLSPEEALRRLVESEAVIRDLTQEKLEALCRWIDKMPAYALNYPDLDTALSQIRGILDALPAA